MLIKTPEHHRIFQRCFTTLLLSGQLQTHADKSLRKWMVQIARTYGFAPGMVVKDFDHPEKVYHLLKVASDGSFAAAVNYKPSDFNASSNNVNLKKLKEDIEKRWNSEGNYHKMGDFFKNELMTTNWNNPDDKEHYDPVLQNFKDKMTENAEELTDNDLIQNPEFANHGGLFSSKAVINSMMRYSRGKFDGEDPEKIAAKQLFWKNLTSDIKHIDTSNSSALETLVKQFLMMFSEKGFGE
ncbi:MAG: hypothetical protein LBO09_02630 [Candidatus Peribacteria bacterium]|nr:hypothetical protein [Candidatus Peribacteria bacterium]